MNAPSHSKPQWTISVNGNIGDEFTSSIPVLDRGFLFGDSVYEVTGTKDGVLLYWEEHYHRLCHSAHGLMMTMTSTMEHLYEHVRKTINASRSTTDVYVRVVATRGFFTDISLFPTSATHVAPNMIVFVKPLPEQPKRFVDRGLDLMVTEHIQRNPRRAVDPNLKTGNYLNSVLALMEARSRGFDDAVMLNQQGYVTEGTTFNIWGVTGQRLITPPLESGLLMGITRRQIIEIAHAASMEIVEQEMTAEQLLTMDEVFVSGSIKNILPVYRLNHRVFDGPRPVTMKLQKLYADHCAEYVRKHRQWQTFR